MAQKNEKMVQLRSDSNSVETIPCRRLRSSVSMGENECHANDSVHLETTTKSKESTSCSAVLEINGVEEKISPLVGDCSTHDRGERGCR